MGVMPAYTRSQYRIKLEHSFLLGPIPYLLRANLRQLPWPKAVTSPCNVTVGRNSQKCLQTIRSPLILGKLSTNGHLVLNTKTNSENGSNENGIVRQLPDAALESDSRAEKHNHRWDPANSFTPTLSLTSSLSLSLSLKSVAWQSPHKLHSCTFC